jgi:hypothetical protein
LLFRWHRKIVSRYVLNYHKGLKQPFYSYREVEQRRIECALVVNVRRSQIG